ncbi:rnase p rpr2 rpp21 snm1 subunit domain-containing protein [Diaporthe amygdali]|uniref:rnase p rpr2 rpp21 snm1 subunit domain-containing protein n=1 Tax=Phomopsis amygdali TaxID=1214568 RepID=UPI0022FE3F03|nr:rnase p rpr2 rpp21 snm1 subunit domain-containing protein [Diaporthe amygdali]KAJ0124658.1 rnase p rpr2 rpp21 snm1 subunit domain-containing protein [Diaporthe amygdali]
MVSSDLGPQLQFLTDAAHLLSASSPETSAFLMSRRTSLLVDHDVPISDQQRQHVCSCCGHIMLPGRGTELKIGADRALKARVKKQSKTQSAPVSASQKPGISKVFSCGKCSRYTKLQLPAPRPLPKARAKSQSKSKTVNQERMSQEKRPSAAAAEPAKLSANASSKKRAKNRKAGLQALLDQRSGQSSTASSGLGLSLSDFMKK